MDDFQAGLRRQRSRLRQVSSCPSRQRIAHVIALTANCDTGHCVTYTRVHTGSEVALCRRTIATCWTC